MNLHALYWNKAISNYFCGQGIALAEGSSNKPPKGMPEPSVTLYIHSLCGTQLTPTMVR